MPQGPLPFQYESDVHGAALTSLGGLPLYLDLISVLRLPEMIRARLNLRPTQGFSDVQQLLSLVMLNLAGGDCLDDLRILEDDPGFAGLLDEVERHGLRAAERQKLDARFRRNNQGTLPSPSAAGRYLELFHHPEQEHLREAGTAFVPEPNPALEQLAMLPSDLVAWAQWSRPQTVATLDQDATLSRTHKADALRCYKKYKAYQPLNIYWCEHGMVHYSEFRDGNCPAGWRNLEVLKRGLELLPSGVREVKFRGDSAAYEIELLKFCAEGRSDYGVIEFAISADVTHAFRAAVAEVAEEAWHPYLAEDGYGGYIKTGQEWAEVGFVPNWAGHSKTGPEYRFLAIREPLAQLELPSLESPQEELPFPMTELDGERYKLFGVVTNRSREDKAGDEVIRWHRKRCGHSEQAHSSMKSDLAGGQFPSGLFGANAAWWQIMLVALNVEALMERQMLGQQWKGRRMKHVRFTLIHLPARVVHTGRRTLLRIPPDHPTLPAILAARGRMLQMSTGPPCKWLSAA